jgi:hypothetical protein
MGATYFAQTAQHSDLLSQSAGCAPSASARNTEAMCALGSDCITASRLERSAIERSDHVYVSVSPPPINTAPASHLTSPRPPPTRQRNFWRPHPEPYTAQHDDHEIGLPLQRHRYHREVSISSHLASKTWKLTLAKPPTIFAASLCAPI